MKIELSYISQPVDDNERSEPGAIIYRPGLNINVIANEEDETISDIDEGKRNILITLLAAYTRTIPKSSIELLCCLGVDADEARRFTEAVISKQECRVFLDQIKFKALEFGPPTARRKH